LRKQLQEHRHFILIIPVLIIVMTWPTFYHVLETDTVWLPGSGEDVWFELWEGWYGGQILQCKADLFYTNLLYYPQGVSLAYHQYTLPHMLIYALLRALLPVSNAYNLAFLLTLFANALATYACANYFIKDKWISLFAAAVVGISVALRIKSDAQFWTYYSIPLSIYFMHRAVVENRRTFAFLCGVAVGITVYIGFYVLVCLVISVGIYGLYLAWSRWRDPRFWAVAAFAIVICALVSLPRLAPMLADGEQVDAVLAYRTNWQNRSKDLLDFLRHPLWTGDVSFEPGYLGFVPTVLVGVGLVRHARRRKLLPWLLLLLVFMILRAGTFLTVADLEFPDILLPKHYLNYIFPEIFRGFTGNHHWVLGALLPWAILSCYGLQTLLGAKTANKRSAVLLALIALMALEYSYGPITGQVVKEERTAFVDWFEGEDEAAPRLINLPMNTAVVRRYYNYIQMLTGYPQVEGALNRVFPEANNYIWSNYLLSAWKTGAAAHCTPATRAAFEPALDQLLNDGFTHLLMHSGRYFTQAEPHSFASVPAAYSDDYLSIYRLGDLRRSCENSAMLGHGSLPHWRDLALSTEILPDPDVALLSVFPTHSIEDDLFDFYVSIFDDWADFVHVYVSDGEIAIQSSNARHSDLNSVLENNQLILRLTDPRQDETALYKPMNDRLSREFQPCFPLMRTPDSFAEYFIDSAFPCEILRPEQRKNIQYSNGIELAYLANEPQDAWLDLYFFWRYQYERDGTHAYSIQVFDAAGQKPQQADHVIGHNPLEHRQLDLRALSPGDYSVKLILYNYSTGDSISGFDADSQAGFERELELARVTVE